MYDRTDTAAVKEISVISNQNAKVQLKGKKQFSNLLE